VEDQLYDKKFVFLPETINPKKMKELSQFGKKGVMII